MRYTPRKFLHHTTGGCAYLIVVPVTTDVVIYTGYTFPVDTYAMRNKVNIKLNKLIKYV